MKLFEYHIHCEVWGPIRAQCLAYLINELARVQDPDADEWVLSVDGFSNTKGGRVGIMLQGPNNLLEQSLCFGFKLSNNQVEYEVVIIGLLLEREMGWRISRAGEIPNWWWDTWRALFK